MSHRDFMRHELPRRWGLARPYRIRLGKTELPHREINHWCSEHFERWYRSDGNEVYFFADSDAATHFKMRWIG